MNLFNLFSEIEKVDADAPERLAHYSRREMFRLGSKAAVAAAAPMIMAASVNKAYAQSDAIKEVLNFALTLEYLEAAFYTKGYGTTGLIPAADRNVIDQIRKHEVAHVALLKGAGATVSEPMFDFTAGGTYSTVFSSYLTFLTLAQAFEDTGVRAYKGQAGVLKGTDYLTVALQIHSVEARHAAQIRRMQGMTPGGLTGQQGWIKNDEGVNALVYKGEANMVQGGLDLGRLNTLAGISADQRTESFDEPLTKAEVLAIAGGFIKG